VYLKLNSFILHLFFDVSCYTSFKEHLLDDAHNRWPKHVVYNEINLHICIWTCWSYIS